MNKLNRFESPKGFVAIKAPNIVEGVPYNLCKGCDYYPIARKDNTECGCIDVKRQDRTNVIFKRI